MSEDSKKVTEAAEPKAAEPAKLTRFFLPPGFDLSGLQSIYSSLRDGDYYGAFKHAIKFLDNLINPPLTVKTASGLGLSDEDSLKLENQLAFIKKTAKNWSEKGAVKASAPDAPQLDPATIISVILMVVEFVRRYRGR